MWLGISLGERKRPLRISNSHILELERDFLCSGKYCTTNEYKNSTLSLHPVYMDAPHYTFSLLHVLNIFCAFLLGFPMSSFLKEKKFQLGRNARMMAAQPAGRMAESGEVIFFNSKCCFPQFFVYFRYFYANRARVSHNDCLAFSSVCARFLSLLKIVV